ncbi:MAG: hypothetical protein OQL19_09060 [Gammaproteobacteria bacterium]|nr:hypothetical protein [Gammaproteobacteria bacterium]
MKALLSILFIFFVVTFSIAHANDTNADEPNANEEIDYCYKPSKPLIFSTSKYKNRYLEDVKEYQRCRQGFLEMQARVASMKAESEKNAKKMEENFIIKHY